MTRVPLRLRCALCHPTLDAGSRESRREIYSRSLLQELLDSASQRGMTRVPPRLRCALCHPARDAGPRESRWEIYLRSLLQELLDSASLRGMTEPPHQVRNDIVVGISLKLVLWNAPEYALCSAAIPPPLSGREEASRPRPEGEDCLSAASSAAPEGGASLRAR